jgi:hypothetical protein
LAQGASARTRIAPIENRLTQKSTMSKSAIADPPEIETAPTHEVSVELVQDDFFQKFCKFEEGVGLTFKRNTPFEAWQSITEGFGAHHLKGLFILGDCLRQGEEMYGDKYAQVIDPRRYDIKTLQNAMWVCKAIASERRRKELSFSHHREVAGLPPKVQDALLDEAVKSNWTVRDIKKAKNEKYPDLEKKSVKVKRDAEKGKLKFNLNDEDAIIQCGEAVLAYFEQEEEKKKIGEWPKNRISRWIKISHAIACIHKRLGRAKGTE